MAIGKVSLGTLTFPATIVSSASEDVHALGLLGQFGAENRVCDGYQFLRALGHLFNCVWWVAFGVRDPVAGNTISGLRLKLPGSA